MSATISSGDKSRKALTVGSGSMSCITLNAQESREQLQNLYRQRSAVERINSQAVALDIERPHLRNGRAIANQNTLIYVLINLRFLQRFRENRPAPD
jgi:hypothetical protein